MIKLLIANKGASLLSLPFEGSGLPNAVTNNSSRLMRYITLWIYTTKT